jgi:hypothetical protein
MALNARFCERCSKNGNKTTLTSMGCPENNSFMGGGAVAGRNAEKIELMVDVNEGGVSSCMSRYALLIS